MTRPSLRIRQPRVAEIVASRLRDDILSGRLKEGDVLASQESMFGEFGVSPPALREAIHILESDGLVSVRRGNVGGAVVHQPSAERTAHMIGMVLQSRAATPADVSAALVYLEPICAGMCAAREDRMTQVVPYLEAEIRQQTEQFDDAARFVSNARRFHETIVSRCGNEAMILLIGSLELIWSAHESSVWSDDGHDGLAKVGVGNADDGAFGDARNRFDRGFDLGGINVIPAGNDKVLGSPRDIDVTVLIDVTEIA